MTLLRIVRGIRRRVIITIGKVLLLGNKLPLPFYVSHSPDALYSGKFNDLKAIIPYWEKGVKYNNRGDYARLYFLMANVRQLLDRNIAGDFAELGVYKGNSSKLFSTMAPERKLWMFDTFEGFDERDLKSETITTLKDHFHDTSAEAIGRFIKSENSVICKGYFPETAVHVPEGTKFALVHLDADLYEPILAGLNYFYPRMSKGGLIIVHDYYSGLWPGATRAVDEFFKDKTEVPVIVPDKSGTVVVVKN